MTATTSPDAHPRDPRMHRTQPVLDTPRPRPEHQTTAWLVLSGQLYPDTVARLCDLLRSYGAITSLQRRALRFTAATSAVRIEVRGDAVRELLCAQLHPAAADTEVQLRLDTDPIRTTAFISRDRHGLDALLGVAGEVRPAIELSRVISNHDDHDAVLTDSSVPYHHIPVRPGDHLAAESRALALIRSDDLVVLAGYRPVLSSYFLEHLEIPVISTRHSVVTAAYAGNWKPEHCGPNPVFIEASARYLTASSGGPYFSPAIAEDVAPLPHHASPQTRHSYQASLEARVLVQALQRHRDLRVCQVAGETVVFD